MIFMGIWCTILRLKLDKLNANIIVFINVQNFNLKW